MNVVSCSSFCWNLRNLTPTPVNFDERGLMSPSLVIPLVLDAQSEISWRTERTMYAVEYFHSIKTRIRERIKRKVFFRFCISYKYRELNLNVHLNILSYKYNDNKIVQNQLMKSCYTNTLDLTTTIFDKLVSYLTRKRRVRSSCSI